MDQRHHGNAGPPIACRAVEHAAPDHEALDPVLCAQVAAPALSTSCTKKGSFWRGRISCARISFWPSAPALAPALMPASFTRHHATRAFVEPRLRSGGARTRPMPDDEGGPRHAGWPGPGPRSRSRRHSGMKLEKGRSASSRWASAPRAAACLTRRNTRRLESRGLRREPPAVRAPAHRFSIASMCSRLRSPAGRHRSRSARARLWSLFSGFILSCEALGASLQSRRQVMSLELDDTGRSCRTFQLELARDSIRRSLCLALCARLPKPPSAG